MNTFIVQKAQFEVFMYLLEILMHIEFQFKIDILLSILLCNHLKWKWRIHVFDDM